MGDRWVNLADKVVIVTGGASGIGRHMVIGLRTAGAAVACFDINVTDGVDDETGARLYKVDITDPEAVEAAVARVCDDLGIPRRFARRVLDLEPWTYTRVTAALQRIKEEEEAALRR